MEKRLYSNIPLVLGSESSFVLEAIQNKYIAGDGKYSKMCCQLLEKITGSKKVILTTSCTDALEMAAILTEIGPGDEVIMASYNFVSAANAFVLRGASIRFVDIDPATMNIDTTQIESAITNKTKAIVAMHYGGVPCDMETIMRIANQYHIYVIEDAAHCIGAYYHQNHLGSIGHLGTLSFHETKNIQCGEGGALLINDEKFIERATIIRDKGTDRNLFFNGLVNKYTWVDIGSSFVLGELLCAFLYAQLLSLEKVNDHRKKLWCRYRDYFSTLYNIETGKILSNGHIFYIKCKNSSERSRYSEKLKDNGISAVTHYEPLHVSKAGKKYATFANKDIYTTVESQKLLRLPLYFDMTEDDVALVFSNFQDVG